MSIKKIIYNLLTNQNIEISEFDVDTYSLNESIAEISKTTLLNMTIHYIKGYLYKNIEYYESFIKELEYFKIPEKRFIEIRKSVLRFSDEDDFYDEKIEFTDDFSSKIYKNTNLFTINKVSGDVFHLKNHNFNNQKYQNNNLPDANQNKYKIKKFSRDDKIFISRFQNNFLKKTINLDDRGYILDMLKYFYCKTINESILDISEKQIINQKDDLPKIKPISITKIDKNFFKQENLPTMSLEEYAEKVKMAASHLKNGKKEQNDYEEDNESAENELSRIELLKRDELRDNLERGNTYRRS
ncbi:hypothetical protein DMUE_3781 [Dictyocoela muelleri]|nr:hypothetical protein DMUE_3781 [Dictyocoela muelleri]